MKSLDRVNAFSSLSILWGILLTISLIGLVAGVSSLAVEPVDPKVAASLLDPSFELQKVAGDCAFTEGPVVSAAGDLFFSDGENDRIMRLSAQGELSEFRRPAGRPNGMMFDGQGRLILCQSAGQGGKQRVARLEPDGTETVLADKFEGQPFVGPNDLCIDRQGRIYFTDPIYGKKEDAPQPTSGVYRIDAPGKVTRIIADLQRPNGILLSTDQQLLFVSDRGTQKLHRYQLQADGSVKPDGVLYDFSPDRGIDGMWLDERGNIYGAAGEGKATGLFVVSPAGKLLLHKPLPEFATNVTFGGADRRDLYITASKSVYKLRSMIPGAPLPDAKTSSMPVHFKAETIDDKVTIGYGVTLGDVDGDGKPDILLADKKQFVWYQNPTWKKHLLAENLTEHDNVCIAARDITGDGRVEIAVGAQWNPGDTENSGAVFSLTPPEDRTQPWTPVKLHHEPTVHRMRWVKIDKEQFALVVAPLHGRGNRNSEGAGVKLLAYHPPRDSGSTWDITLLNDGLHATHNLDPCQWDPRTEAEEILYIGREGAVLIAPDGLQSKTYSFERVAGGGEIRRGELTDGTQFIATIEPMHGDKLVCNLSAFNARTKEGSLTKLSGRVVLDDNFNQGHAIAVDRLFDPEAGMQIVAGWRNPNRDGETGLKVYWPAQADGSEWESAWIDRNGIATEDACIGDLNGDGRPDVIAAGRGTGNLKVYWNQPGGSAE